jgi:hypothetical protein
MREHNESAQPATPAPPNRHAGYRRYATARPLRAMDQFTEWIEREFPEFGKLDYRVVTVASKCHPDFQSSDLNRPWSPDAVQQYNDTWAFRPPPAEHNVPMKGYRRYATGGPIWAMAQFTEWIEREFPEFGKLDYRVVTVAYKCYRAFQSSDLNRPWSQTRSW